MRAKASEIEEKEKIDFSYGFTTNPKLLAIALNNKDILLDKVIVEYIK